MRLGMKSGFAPWAAWFYQGALSPHPHPTSLELLDWKDSPSALVEQSH